MKKIISMILLLISVVGARAQECVTDEFFQYKSGVNPAVLDSLDSVTVRYQRYRSYHMPVSNQTIYIPVVFHVVYNTANMSVNVSNSQINSALTTLNSAYGSVGGPTGLGVNQKIVFCLANRDPLSNTTTGITRSTTTYLNFVAPTSTAPGDEAVLKSFDNWGRQHYLNIWICDIQQSGVKGYATFPWLHDSGDGVVVDYQYLSSKTLIHEVGHWLGLFHTHEMQGGSSATCANVDCNAVGDQVCDTPPENIVGWSQVTATSCTQRLDCNANTISAENFMEYNYDNCRTYFSPNQKDRVRAVMESARPELYDASIYYPETLPIECVPVTGTGTSYAGNNSMMNACSGVQFVINGEATDHVVNVCNPNIVLTAHKYASTCGTTANWLYNTTQSDFLCAHTSNMWQAASKTYDGIFNNRCYCIWFRLFIEVVEVDDNLNIIAPAQNQWFYIFDGDQSSQAGEQAMTSFNLNSYLPNGVPLVDGKYYKVKVASYEQGDDSQPWLEHNGYIRLYKDNLTVLNRTITHDQYGSFVTVTNCTVPNANDVQVVAKTRIEINPLTTLNNGDYYIANFTCTDLEQFHLSGPAVETTLEYGGMLSSEVSVADDDEDHTAVINSVSDINEQLSVIVFPNPTEGTFQVQIKNSEGDRYSIELYNSFGTLIWSRPQQESTEVLIDIQGQPQGLYYVKVLSASGETKTIKVNKLK
jgi:hypothetical protein